MNGFVPVFTWSANTENHVRVIVVSVVRKIREA